MHDHHWTDALVNWSSDPEEFANAITHGCGLLLSVVAAVTMTVVVLPTGDPWRVFGCLLYVLSLVAVYAMSTLSHCFSDPKLRRLFRTLDQGCIYLLIAATYTPFSLAFLRYPPWWQFLAVIWTIAAAGFLSKVAWAHRVESVSTWLYVALGWLPVLAATSLVGVVPTAGLKWMLIGGVSYTLGTLFLIFDAHIRHFHAVWHLFVIAGSACHFFAILLYVAPAR